MKNILENRVIAVCFYALFFLVPLILTPWNYELFEFNKMLSVYTLAVIITSLWASRMVATGKIIYTRTPLETPILLFLLSQIASTVFSIDRHVSLFGYYSRFNGGLLSVISFCLLYFAFVSNFPREKIGTLLKFMFASALLVTIYGILEHFGIDKDIWVQDVANRVFSTLGQPNWLAAYVAILIPISLSVTGISKNRFLLILPVSLFLTLIFTKSRSGFIGLIAGLVVFFLLNFIALRKNTAKFFTGVSLSIVLLVFLFGSPFSQISTFTLPELTKNTATNPPQNKPFGGSIIDVGITESGKIRNIVWKGAIEIFKKNMLLGTGVETFAFSYFAERPVEHNMTSEWDFLYNKAHNEFLNYAATSGIIGLGSHLLMIAVFTIWFLRNSLKLPGPSRLLTIGLFSGWVTIPVTNFFGFSVVVVQLFYYLLPAMVFVLVKSDGNPNSPNSPVYKNTADRKILRAFIFLFCIYLLLRIAVWWLADFYFAKGFQDSRAQDYAKSYENIRKAIVLRDKEPLYYDEISVPALQLGLYYAGEKNSTESAKYIKEALEANEKAISISPNNLNFWKTRTRLNYALSSLDARYMDEAVKSLETAKRLSPTDPKIRYNLSLLYDSQDNTTAAYRELDDTIRLKINYRDAYIARAVFYKRDSQKEKARMDLEFIIKRINPDDPEALQMLEELK